MTTTVIALLIIFIIALLIIIGTAAWAACVISGSVDRRIERKTSDNE